MRFLHVLLQSQCWWFGTGHAAGGPSARGVGDSDHRCQRHLTGPVQAEAAYVQCGNHSKPCNSHIPQHTGIHPRQQWTTSSCDSQPARDPHSASQHTSDPHPDSSPYATTATAQKEPLTYGK